jgi:hypothetical protein
MWRRPDPRAFAGIHNVHPEEPVAGVEMGAFEAPAVQDVVGEEAEAHDILHYVIPVDTNLTRNQQRELDAAGIHVARPFTLMDTGIAHSNNNTSPPVQRLRTTHNLGTVHAQSIKLVALSSIDSRRLTNLSNKKQQYSLRFMYTADVDMVASIFFNVKEVNNTLKVRTDNNEHTPQWEKLLLPAGRNMCVGPVVLVLPNGVRPQTH